MTIESKYHELPARRKAAKKTASLCALFAALRTCWAVLVPALAGRAFPSTATLSVAGVAAGVSLLRALGAGFGAPHREKVQLLEIHASLGVALLLLTQLGALAFEHAFTPRENRRPAQLVEAITNLSSFSSSSFSTSLEPSVVENVEKVAEGLLDTGLFLSAIASAVAGRRYLSLKEGAKKK